MSKKKISTKSGKAKGRRLQQYIADKISEITGIKAGKDKDIESRQMGQSGTDVVLRGEAKKLFPYSYIECRNREKWQISQWVEELRSKNESWLLFVKRNRHKAILIIDTDEFFDLYKELIEFRKD